MSETKNLPTGLPYVIQQWETSNYQGIRRSPFFTEKTKFFVTKDEFIQIKRLSAECSRGERFDDLGFVEGIEKLFGVKLSSAIKYECVVVPEVTNRVEHPKPEYCGLGNEAFPELKPVNFKDGLK